MSDDWFSLEQQVHDRIAEARAVARAAALAGRSRAHRRHPGLLEAIRHVSTALAKALARALERSRHLGHPRTAAKRG